MFLLDEHENTHADAPENEVAPQPLYEARWSDEEVERFETVKYICRRPRDIVGVVW
jgi:hypothetical protein